MKTLVLGTCCLDLVINVDKLPQLGLDVNAKDMKIAMGGMAYNVYQAITACGEEAILGCPAGEGIFGDIIMKFYAQKGVEPFVRIKNKDNGLCLCLVSDSGERTFLSYHGAEYKFKKEWYDGLNFDDIDLIYFSGLEVEEDTGDDLIAFLKEKNKKCFFAPSSRVVGLSKEKLNKIFKLRPILHVNEFEASFLAKSEDMAEAADILYSYTKEMVVITLGEKGTYVKTADYEGLISTAVLKENEIVDTIGAGDGHAGALIAALKKNYDIKKAVDYANKLAATALKHHGAGITVN